jgi:hypothetical protein
MERLTNKYEEYELLKERAKRYLGIELETDEEVGNFYQPDNRKIARKVIEFVSTNYPEDSKTSEEYQRYLKDIVDPRD